MTIQEIVIPAAEPESSENAVAKGYSFLAWIPDQARDDSEGVDGL